MNEQYASIRAHESKQISKNVSCATNQCEIIFEKFKHEVDYVIDGGIGGMEPSTIVDCTSGHCEIIRQGLGKFEV